MYQLGTAGWLLACICGIVVGMSKCGIPGTATLAVPLLASVLPAKVATGAMLPMLVAGDLIGALCFRRDANWRLLLKMLPMACAGIFLGYILLGCDWMNDRVIRYVIACIVLALVILNAFKDNLHTMVAGAKDRRWQMWTMVVVFGVLTGLTTMLANAAGPVALIYLLAMRLPKDEFIGTNAWLFLVLNWIKVPFMVHRGMINCDSLIFNVKLLPSLFIGCALGLLLSKRLSDNRFKRWMEILTAIAALMLFF